MLTKILGDEKRIPERKPPKMMMSRHSGKKREEDCSRSTELMWGMRIKMRGEEIKGDSDKSKGPAELQCGSERNSGDRRLGAVATLEEETS